MKVHFPGRSRPRLSQDPDEVIRWLRSKAGEEWSAGRLGHLYRHDMDSGMFADVFPAPRGNGARWPQPWSGDDLDRCGD